MFFSLSWLPSITFATLPVAETRFQTEAVTVEHLQHLLRGARSEESAVNGGLKQSKKKYWKSLIQM